LCVTLCAPACASAGGGRYAAPQTMTHASVRDEALLAAYVKQLPIGARVRATLTNGQSVRGTLMKATDGGVIVQRRTRLPEPPVEIPLAALQSVEGDREGGGVGRAVAIGVATGAGAALGVFLLLVATLAND
ncbi:MAG: hypothetical protein LC804_10325, partial [Acidobacteria bacterium]|nr:hypothetical protein [Acidobacteriota bacterium]